MRFVSLVILSLPLAACSQTWDEGGPYAPSGSAGIMADGTLAEGPGAVSSVSQLPSHDTEGIVAPYGAQGTAAAYEYATGYRVGAGDRISVKVAGEEDITSEYIVDGSGNISMPYVQSLHVGGKTIPAIEKAIASKLKAGYLRDPQVSAQVVSLRPFYIMGEVTTAGSFAYQPGISVQNAIAIAGGFGARADKSTVMITRKNVNGTQTYKVPLTTQIYPGDIIYDRERWF